MNKYQDDTFLTTPNTTPGTTPNTSHNTSHNTSGPASPPGMSEDQAGQVGRPQEIAGEIGTGMDFALPADPLPGHPIEPKLPESPDQKLPDPQLPERPVIPNLPKPRKVMPELREDYIKAYKTYFMHTGDHQIAKELGLLELRRSWAETNADGSGRLTKHAPELEYPSLNADDIKQRFNSDLAAQGFDPETTFLKTDDLTRTQSKTMHPTYALTVNGEALTLPNGAALRWKPNEGLFQVAGEAPANDDMEGGGRF
ncbi:MAG: hypothetical protein HOM51_02695 [Rhodospirillaceae bacterium]|nr:hypothetical protein [Rhodospirillaceae bacterium]